MMSGQIYKVDSLENGPHGSSWAHMTLFFRFYCTDLIVGGLATPT